MLNLPIHEHDIYLHLFKSLIFLSNVFWRVCVCVVGWLVGFYRSGIYCVEFNLNISWFFISLKLIFLLNLLSQFFIASI